MSDYELVKGKATVCSRTIEEAVSFMESFFTLSRLNLIFNCDYMDDEVSGPLRDLVDSSDEIDVKEKYNILFPAFKWIVHESDDLDYMSESYVIRGYTIVKLEFTRTTDVYDIFELSHSLKTSDESKFVAYFYNGSCCIEELFEDHLSGED